MNAQERIQKGKFRLGVKSMPLYKKLLSELGDSFRGQIFMALSFDDKEMIAELKKFCSGEVKQKNISYI